MSYLRASYINEKLYTVKNANGHVIIKAVRDTAANLWTLVTLYGEIIAQSKSCFILFSIYNIRVVEYIWPLSYSVFKYVS